MYFDLTNTCSQTCLCTVSGGLCPLGGRLAPNHPWSKKSFFAQHEQQARLTFKHYKELDIGLRYTTEHERKGILGECVLSEDEIHLNKSHLGTHRKHTQTLWVEIPCLTVTVGLVYVHLEIILI